MADLDVIRTEQEKRDKKSTDVKAYLPTYRISPPLIKPSRLASREKGGIGKDLSEGWGLNFSVGCTHGCIFCYADQIHKRRLPLSKAVWGNYFFTPSNFYDALAHTPWKKWKGKEVLMSATHDPYLPQLLTYTRTILETALREGVRFCIQTRSPHVLKDIAILKEHKPQVRVQVSIATYDYSFYRLIEPHVADPERRLKVIEVSKEEGIETGVIVAPIFPSLNRYRDFREDLVALFERLSEVRPDRVFGEALHARGNNLRLIDEKLGVSLSRNELYQADHVIGETFEELLSTYQLKGQWWPEHACRGSSD